MTSLVNRLHRKYSQRGGGIPFSAMRRKSKKRKGSKKSKRPKKSQSEKSCQCGSHTYTGREETPRGLGECEECIPLNVILKGKDGNLYENKETGWVKV